MDSLQSMRKFKERWKEHWSAQRLGKTGIHRYSWYLSFHRIMACWRLTLAQLKEMPENLYFNSICKLSTLTCIFSIFSVVHSTYYDLPSSWKTFLHIFSYTGVLMIHLSIYLHEEVFILSMTLKAIFVRYGIGMINYFSLYILQRICSTIFYLAF